MSRKEMPSLSEGRAYYRSPIGTIEIIGNEQGLLAVGFLATEPAAAPPAPRALRRAIREGDE